MIYHDPAQDLPSVNTIYAIIVTDQNGNQSLAGGTFGGNIMQCVTAKRTNAERMLKMVQAGTPKKCEIVEFVRKGPHH